MKFVLTLLAALVTLPLLAAQSLAQDYQLQRGDTIQIEVLEDDNLNRSALVLPDGQVSLPMVGSVPAAGRTLEQVRADIAGRLASSFAAPPTVYVTLGALRERVPGVAATIDVYIMGEANAPGRVSIAPGSTLLQAIAAAGGLSPFAAPQRIQLRRADKSGNEKIYKVDFDAIMAGTSNQGTTRLKSGDVIVVPQRRLFE